MPSFTELSRWHQSKNFSVNWLLAQETKDLSSLSDDISSNFIFHLHVCLETMFLSTNGRKAVRHERVLNNTRKHLSFPDNKSSFDGFIFLLSLLFLISLNKTRFSNNSNISSVYHWEPTICVFSLTVRH